MFALVTHVGLLFLPIKMKELHPPEFVAVRQLTVDFVSPIPLAKPRPLVQSTSMVETARAGNSKQLMTNPQVPVMHPEAEHKPRDKKAVIADKHKVVKLQPLQPSSHTPSKKMKAISQPPARRSDAEPGKIDQALRTAKRANATIEPAAAGRQSQNVSLIRARPLYEKNRPPPYPELARRRGWQGVVLLAVTVSAKGLVEKADVESSCGHRLLDDTALKAVKAWHFMAGTENGRHVAMEVLVPVHFNLLQ